MKWPTPLGVAVRSQDIAVLQKHVGLANSVSKNMAERIWGLALGQVLTIGLVVAALVISSIVPSRRELVVVTTLLAVLRISVALSSLRIVVVLVSGLFVSTPILLEVL